MARIPYFAIALLSKSLNSLDAFLIRCSKVKTSFCLFSVIMEGIFGLLEIRILPHLKTECSTLSLSMGNAPGQHTEKSIASACRKSRMLRSVVYGNRSIQICGSHRRVKSCSTAFSWKWILDALREHDSCFNTGQPEQSTPFHRQNSIHSGSDTVPTIRLFPYSIHMSESDCSDSVIYIVTVRITDIKFQIRCTDVCYKNIVASEVHDRMHPAYGTKFSLCKSQKKCFGLRRLKKIAY